MPVITIEKNINLKAFNTFGVDASARYLCRLRQPLELLELFETEEIRELAGNRVNILVLGEGSNLLFTEDYPGLIIKNEIRGIRVLEEDEKSILVEAGAGERWNDLVGYTVGRGWGGMENLGGIPGTVGAAPVQNIGAYGVEVSSLIERVTAWHIDSKKWLTLSNADCRFGYRDSIFKNELKNKAIIVSAVFRLTKGTVAMSLSYAALTAELKRRNVSHPDIREVFEVVQDVRRTRLPDPATMGNAGSFFKNPVIDSGHKSRLEKEYPDLSFNPHGTGYKIAAGWLIEKAGWKGYRSGDAGCYENQALILVNYGSATGKDILELSERIQASVLEKFGISLEREVNLIP
ncbi:MAG: UDP-N-acetylmuramate dehydrogenase [Bacteroidales bacterium]|nr:UDP-N-acetylmuramate dehydrogenase [Bacteroidales bacterium]